MKMHASGENYLETILLLKQEKGYVRSIDIATKMGFSKPSVSRTVGLLRENGYITMDPKDSFIELTEQGREVAERMYERHTVLTRMLTSLGVPQQIAAEDACKLEHAISDESFEAIRHHLETHRK